MNTNTGKLSEEECQSLAHETFNEMIRKFCCNSIFYNNESHSREPYDSTHYGEEYDSTITFVPDKRVYPLGNILAAMATERVANRDLSRRFMEVVVKRFLNPERKLIEHPKYERHEDFLTRTMCVEPIAENGYYSWGYYDSKPSFQGDFYLEDNAWALTAVSMAGLEDKTTDLHRSVKDTFFDPKSNRFMSKISSGEYDLLGMGGHFIYDNALITLALYAVGDADAKQHAKRIISPLDKGGFLNKDGTLRWTNQDKDASQALVALMLYLVDDESRELAERVKEHEKELMNYRVESSSYGTEWFASDFLSICALNMMGERDFSKQLLSKIRRASGWTKITTPAAYAMQAIAYSEKPLFQEPIK